MAWEKASNLCQLIEYGRQSEHVTSKRLNILTNDYNVFHLG